MNYTVLVVCLYGKVQLSLVKHSSHLLLLYFVRILFHYKYLQLKIVLLSTVFIYPIIITGFSNLFESNIYFFIFLFFLVLFKLKFESKITANLTFWIYNKLLNIPSKPFNGRINWLCMIHSQLQFIFRMCFFKFNHNGRTKIIMWLY